MVLARNYYRMIVHVIPQIPDDRHILGYVSGADEQYLALDFPIVLHITPHMSPQNISTQDFERLGMSELMQKVFEYKGERNGGRLQLHHQAIKQIVPVLDTRNLSVWRFRSLEEHMHLHNNCIVLLGDSEEESMEKRNDGNAMRLKMLKAFRKFPDTRVLCVDYFSHYCGSDEELKFQGAPKSEYSGDLTD